MTMPITKSTTNIEIIDRDHVRIAGQQVPVSWCEAGADVSVDDIAAVSDAADANWSRQEILDLACHAMTRMDEAFTRAYDIATPEGDFVDGWHVFETIRVADDAAANAYAEKHYAGQDWYVLHDGENING